MTHPSPPADTTASWAAAARAAGAIVILGYVLGIAQGPIVALVGGLGLITFGRALPAGRLEGAFLGAALAIIAGALGIAALRWGALDLDGIRAVQAFFGPTLLVEPVAAAASSWLAAGASVVALGLWLGIPSRGLLSVAGWIAEALLGALAIVTMFWGEAIVGWGKGPGSVWPEAGEWAVAAAVTGSTSLALAALFGRISLRWRGTVLGVAGAVVPVSALVTASAVKGVV